VLAAWVAAAEGAALSRDNRANRRVVTGHDADTEAVIVANGRLPTVGRACPPFLTNLYNGSSPSQTRVSELSQGPTDGVVNFPVLRFVFPVRPFKIPCFDFRFFWHLWRVLRGIVTCFDGAGGLST